MTNPDDSLDLLLVALLAAGGAVLYLRARQAQAAAGQALATLLSQGQQIIADNQRVTSIPGGSSFYQAGFGYGGPSYNT